MRNFYKYENAYFIGKCLQKVQVKNWSCANCSRCALKKSVNLIII